MAWERRREDRGEGNVEIEFNIFAVVFISETQISSLGDWELSRHRNKPDH